FNILASLDYRRQHRLEARDRRFAETGVLGPTRDDILAGTSGTSFPGDLNGFEPSGPGCAPPNSIPVNNAAGTAFQSCRYDFTRDIDIIPENDQITGLIRGTLKLGQNHQVSAEYLRAENNVITQVAPNPVSQFLPVTSPFFPAGATPTTVPGFGLGGVVNWRQVPAGKRTSESEAVTERLLAEISGAAVGWDYRAGIGTAKNKTIEFATRGYLQDDPIQAGLIAGIINPFGPQTAAGSAAIEAAQTNQQTQTSKGDVDFIDARVSRDLFMLPAGPLAAAIGAEYRREEYSYEALPITGQIPSLGIDPDSDVSGKRNVKALFAELSIPIIRNLEATLAARYDRYSDSGSTFNPKVALRFQPIPQVLLRGSYNTGFRAPTLYEIFQPQSLTFTSDNYDDPLLCPGGTAIPPATDGAVCGQQVLQRFGGPIATGRAASALEPEESRTFTFGVVLEPIPQVTLTADAFWIKIENTIAVLPEQAIFEDPATYAGRFFRCSQISPAQRANIDVCLNFPTFDPIAFIDAPNENLGEIKTNGIDLGADWRLPATSFGRFSLSINGTYIDKYEYQRVRNGEFIQNAGRYADNAPIFRWQHIAAVNWTLGPWAATLANKFKSGYDDQDPVNEVVSYSTWDLTGTWTGFRGLTVTAGVRNLFDEDPPFTNQNTTFQRGYDPRFTDPRGRTYLVRVGYKFF
ncbi:MAG: TonB-dependent receptor domain-containing protein, partial [Burkholderiaceae bacterium]